MTPSRQHPRPSSRTLRTGLPYLGLAALLLASGQSLVAQGAYVPPPPPPGPPPPPPPNSIRGRGPPAQFPVALPSPPGSPLIPQTGAQP